MREIKFRAWLPHLERFAKETEATDNLMNIFNGKLVFEFDEMQGRGIDYFTDGSYILEQFTGLRDKNEKGIYEGDILFWDGSILGVVRFEHAEYIVGQGVNARALCAAKEDQLEVIGNIHENPELINE